MIDEQLLIKELNFRVRTKRSTMEIIRDIIPLVETQPKVSEQEIRNKAIDELKELVSGHKYTNAEDGTTVEEMLRDENTEKKYAWHLSNNECCDWMLHRLDEIAEKMKEVGE